jgi:TH1 protein
VVVVHEVSDRLTMFHPIPTTYLSNVFSDMYGYELLCFLVKKARKNASSMLEAERLLYARVIRKWERLLEVLQGTMIDPSSDPAVSSPLFRKRRLDVACTMSELHQRQRRRILPSTIVEQDEGEGRNGNGGGTVSVDASSSVRGGDDRRRSEIETALLSFLRNYCLGTQLDDPILDRMLPNALGGDPANLIGNLLIKYPISVEALLGYIYKPGNQRVRSGSTRNKCARLIAKAVMAAECKTMAEARALNQTVPESEFDEVNLESMLCEGSKLCEQLENMVSFIVTAGGAKRKGILSPGEQLCRLAVACAPISQGVAMWAREITKGGEFVNSASYPTISPNIMSLVRIIYLQHPFTRDDTCAVAFEFLKHTNSDIAYQTMNHIKEQSLRLLLFLCVRGEGPTVLDRVLKLVSDPSGSLLDASLIRYFVAGLLEVAQPPFSIPLIRSLAALLKSRPCVDAIKTSYFDEDSKKRLDAVMKYLKLRATGKLDSRALAREDVGLMQAILSIYATQNIR